MAAPAAAVVAKKVAQKLIADLVSEPEKGIRNILMIIFVPLIFFLLLFVVPVVIFMSIPLLLFGGGGSSGGNNLTSEQLNSMAIYQKAPSTINQENLDWIEKTKKDYSGYDDIVVKSNYTLTWQPILAIDTARLNQDYTKANDKDVTDLARKFVVRTVTTETYEVKVPTYKELGSGLYDSNKNKVNTDYKIVSSLPSISSCKAGDKFYVDGKGLFAVGNTYYELGSGVYTSSSTTSSIKIVSSLPDPQSCTVGDKYYANGNGYYEVIGTTTYYLFGSEIDYNDIPSYLWFGVTTKTVNSFSLISSSKPSELQNVNIYNSKSNFPDVNSVSKNTILYSINENKTYKCSTSSSFTQLPTPKELSNVSIYTDYSNLPSAEKTQDGAVAYCINQNKSYSKDYRTEQRKRAILNINTKSFSDVLSTMNFDDFQKETATNYYNSLQNIDAEGNLNIYDGNLDNLQEYPPGSATIPYFNQADARWGNSPYGNSTIAQGGCGPTSLSMVIAGLTGRSDINPKVIADWSVAHGYRIDGAGSAWELMPAGGKAYGLNVETASRTDPNKIVQALSQGKPVIASMGRGHFTNGGHFIVLRGVTKDGKILVNDPASYNRTQQEWDINIIMGESSTNGGVNGSPFWIFSK